MERTGGTGVATNAIYYEKRSLSRARDYFLMRVYDSPVQNCGEVSIRCSQSKWQKTTPIQSCRASTRPCVTGDLPSPEQHFSHPEAFAE